MIVLLALFCLGMTTWAARDPHLLLISNVTMMVCIPLLGGAPFQMFDHTSTVGNIFFAAAIYGLALEYQLHGPAAAHAAVRNILFGLGIVCGAILLLNQYKVNTLFQIPSRMIAASFISFWFVQSLFIHTIEKHAPDSVHAVPRILLATILMHTIGTAIFFPGAFYGLLSNDQLLKFTIVGWVTKCAFVVLSYPFMAFGFWFFRHRPEPQ